MLVISTVIDCFFYEKVKTKQKQKKYCCCCWLNMVLYTAALCFPVDRGAVQLSEVQRLSRRSWFLRLSPVALVRHPGLRRRHRASSPLLPSRMQPRLQEIQSPVGSRRLDHRSLQVKHLGLNLSIITLKNTRRWVDPWIWVRMRIWAQKLLGWI